MLGTRDTIKIEKTWLHNFFFLILILILMLKKKCGGGLGHMGWPATPHFRRGVAQPSPNFFLFSL
jgi:hypothetical protein